MESLSVDVEPILKLVEDTADSGDSPKPEVLLFILGVIEKIKGECDVMKQRKRAQEEECKELRSKCEASMTDFEKNPTVVAKREKMSTLSTEAKERKANHVSVPHIGNFGGP
ncbi:hypothetical protein Tco_1341307 [Tanacetum coccineum]